MSIFSDRIKDLRVEKGYSQADIAELLDWKKQTWQRYEAGKVVPSLDTAARIADALEVSLDYLAGRTDKEEVNR